MDLDSLKYAELRTLAKTLGLKANVKADKLVAAIKQYYQLNQEAPQQQDGQGNENGLFDGVEEENSPQNLVQEDNNGTYEEPAPTLSLFVTKRRGRPTKTKRKSPDSQTKTTADTQRVPDPIKDGERASSSAGGGNKKVQWTPEEEALASGDEQQSEINDEVPVLRDKDNKPKVAKPGKIPRYEALQKKTKPLLKPATPNFKKLHEAYFNKMESIDSYVMRKTKQMDTYRNAVQELKANPCHASMFSPVAANKKTAEDKRRHTTQSTSNPRKSKPARKEDDASFRPSVLSTRRINVRFSQTLHDENKGSLVKMPTYTSLCMASSTPGKQTSNGGKTSTASVTKTPGPFVFTGNTSVSNTPGTNKKSTFDLKASLSRPLTYKPHKGKLKPFGDAKENTVQNQSLSSNSHQTRYKQHQVQTREERRATHLEGRKQKKENILGARRGLVMK